MRWLSDLLFNFESRKLILMFQYLYNVHIQLKMIFPTSIDYNSLNKVMLGHAHNT